MITFKQFLLEGGGATAEFETQRANKSDVEEALKFVEKHTKIPLDVLQDSLLGSTEHTLKGKRKDSGDIDIAVEDGKFDRTALVEKMKSATGVEKVKTTGGNVFSFPVPVSRSKRVQVDLMFVPSVKWAKFGYHSALDSKHKGVVRNFLLVNLMKHIFESGKDIAIEDKDTGEELIRVRRGFKMDAGLERLYRVAPMRKDGKGRLGLKPATPEQVEAELKKLGINEPFSKDADPILEPDEAAAFMFGKGVKASDLLSAEQVITQIYKRKDHAQIFKDAIEDLNKNDLEVPAEIAKFA